jgi:hypothetical protein
MLFSHSVNIVDIVLCNPPLRFVAVSLSNAGHCIESRLEGVLGSSLDRILFRVSLCATRGGISTGGRT